MSSDTCLPFNSRLILGGSEKLALHPQTRFEAILTSTWSFLADSNIIWSNATNYGTRAEKISVLTYDRNFRDSYSTYLGNQYSRIHDYERERQENDHSTGDYTLGDHFGFVKGATSVRARAINELIKDYSLKSSFFWKAIRPFRTSTNFFLPLKVYLHKCNLISHRSFRSVYFGYPIFVDYSNHSCRTNDSSSLQYIYLEVTLIHENKHMY